MPDWSTCLSSDDRLVQVLCVQYKIAFAVDREFFATHARKGKWRVGDEGDGEMAGWEDGGMGGSGG